MKRHLCTSYLPFVWSLVLSTAMLVPCWNAAATPAITSVVPARNASGVSPTAAIVFTFSEAMDPEQTSAQFITSTYQFLTTFSTNWSAGNTVLTYTPTAPMPAGLIIWALDGVSLGEEDLSDGNMFYVSASGTGCDSSTSMLSFTVSKSKSFSQASAGAPVASASYARCFLSCMTIPCPRNATNVTMRSPLGLTLNMGSTAITGHLQHQDCSFTDQASLDTAFPSGDYLFTVQSAASNQAVTVQLPPSLSYPPAPHISNFAAAQTIDPTKPFTVTWDAIPGGSASHVITFEVYGSLVTPVMGQAGAMNGTATSYTIPANTLDPDQTYSCGLVFQNYALATNSTAVTLAYLGTLTEFTISTSLGGSSPLVLKNAACGVLGTGAGFAFEVNCSVGQQLVAEYCSDLGMKQWQQFATTNAATTSVRFVDPRTLGSTPVFYRVRTQ